jgi:type II secretory pathway pseudopilin PulG
MIRDLRRHTGGFTILETIIVLSVTIALMGSMLVLFQQRVPRTQFTKAVNELSVQLSDIVSQVGSGHYPSSNDFRCAVNGSGVASLSAGTNTQGTNEQCVYIGQAIRSGPDSCAPECDQITKYTVFGSRAGSGVSATSIEDSKAQISSDIFARKQYTTGYGLSIRKIKINDPLDARAFAGFGFIQSFGSAVGLGGDLTGSSQVVLVPLISGSGVGTPESVFVGSVNSVTGVWSDKNPQQGILICLQSGATRQFATLVLGAGGNPNNIEQRIINQSDWNSLGCSV